MPQIILVQGFCPLKIKITPFPNGFRLKSSNYLTERVKRYVNVYEC